MSPELQQILTSLTKFGDKVEARQWFKENKAEIVTLLTDLFEEQPNEYQNVITDIIGNFPHGTVGVIRNEIQSGVSNLLAQRIKERLKPHWRDDVEPPVFMPDKNGKILPTQRLLVEILQKSKYIKLVFEEHTGQASFEVYGEWKLPWVTSDRNALKLEYHRLHKFKDVIETIYYPADLKYQQSALKFYLANFFDKEVDWKALRDAIIYAAHENKINAIQDYFNNGLVEWDSEDHFDILYRHAGARNKTWARVIMKSIMLGMMARIYEPGYNYRGTPVLIGDEKIGKSWFAEMLSIHKRFYLQFTFDKNTSEDEAGRKLEGRLVVELADTGGLGSRSNNAIKEFITKTEASFRRMRVDLVEDIPRSFVIIVTANEMEPFLGTAGSTRFMPIEVFMFDQESILKELPQLFAQAKYLWDIGQRPHLTEEEEQLQAEMIMHHEVKPNFYYLLLEKLKTDYGNCFKPDPDKWQNGIKISDVIGWFRSEQWFAGDRESRYRSEIIKILKQYFHIEMRARKKPERLRNIADKPENDYNYCYYGTVEWQEFILSLDK